MAEYNSSCINSLKKQIGLPESWKRETETVLENPKVAASLKEGTLDVFCQVSSSSVIIPIIAANSSIQHIKLYFTSVDIEDFSITPKIYGVHPAAKSLRSLLLRHCTFNNIAAPWNFSCLEELVLHESEVTDEVLQAINQGCPTLKFINLRFCNKFTDVGLKYLAEGCKCVEQLNLSYCRQLGFTDAGLHHISRGMLKLKDLNLEACSNISNAGIKHLADGCHDIEVLCLLSCSNLTDTAIQYLLDGCPKIRDLNMEFCGLISDDGLALMRFPDLQILDLSNLPNLTDKGM
jgi:hypothetical protein